MCVCGKEGGGGGGVKTVCTTFQNVVVLNTAAIVATFVHAIV